MALDEDETPKITELQLLWRQWPNYLYLYLSVRGYISEAMGKPCKFKSKELVQQRSCLRQQYVNQVTLSYAAVINSPTNINGTKGKILFITHAT